MTGFIEAFIISSEKRTEVLDKCKTASERERTEQLIRPILRGRDIKRYGYDFADLWLINTHNGIKENGVKPINIKDYPAVKKHLDNYYVELEKRTDKGDTPYNLRNCAYMDDFSKQKILWAETMRIHKGNHKNFPRFGIETEGKFLTDKTCFFATGSHLNFILAILNSNFGGYLCSQYVSILDDGGYLMQKIYLERIPIAPYSSKLEKLIGKRQNDKIENDINEIVYQLYNLSKDEIDFIESAKNQPLQR